MKPLFLTTTIILAICLAGCSNTNPQGRIPVSGEVTLNGKPVQEGNIEFTTVKGATPSVMTGAAIKNGKFETDAPNGLIPGQTYTVKIAALEEVAGEFSITPTGDKTPLKKDVTPPQWSNQSKETITVEKNKPAIFNFKM
ncbi:MAG: hypothetical protein LBP59_08415 [Planctomycetaceae bacterium]|jgi:hypothetical protein|nr:hypothetical protein [Planctomycetaceae bacterium]